MKVREIVKALRRDGWVMEARRGTAHMHFTHPTKPGKVTVADHKGDVSPKVLAWIEQQSGVKLGRG